MYTPEKVYHISLYNDHYVMYSILTESYDQELLNTPSYMFLPSLVCKVLLEQSKCSKYLTGFLRHYIQGFTHYNMLLCNKEMLRASPKMRIPYSRNWPIERSLVVICGMCNTCSRHILKALLLTLCFRITAPSPSI